MSPVRRRAPLVVLLAAVLAAGVVTVPAAARSGPRSTPPADAVVRWNAIAERTISAGTAVVPASSLPYAFVALAVHDAVAAVERRYAPYLPHEGPHARGVASVDIAVATAAHDVLAHQYPAQAPALAVELSLALAAGPGGAAERQGQRIGRAAAARLLAVREGDGVGATVPSPLPSEPGDWQFGTTPAAPMLVAWLGFVTPLVLPSATHFPPPGPDDLTSAAYARDLAEVAVHGTAADRTDGHQQRAAVAAFHAGNVVQQHQVALRREVVERGLDAADAARAFALLSTGIADALISCWREKHRAAFWRPVTAVRLADLDGNDATSAEPGWQPRTAAPAYPEYPSGHACVTGAATGTYSALFGERIDVDLTAAGTLRHYATARDLDQEAMDGRIWLGIHFRTAMVDGNALGHAVAQWTVTHALVPLRSPGTHR